MLSFTRSCVFHQILDTIKGRFPLEAFLLSVEKYIYFFFNLIGQLIFTFIIRWLFFNRLATSCVKLMASHWTKPYTMNYCQSWSKILHSLLLLNVRKIYFCFFFNSKRLLVLLEIVQRYTEVQYRWKVSAVSECAVIGCTWPFVWHSFVKGLI